MTQLKAVQDIVIVKRDVGESVNHFGLIIPDSFASKPNQGTVTSAGPDAVSSIKPGVRVLLADQAGFDVQVDKVDHLITKELAMIAVIKPDSETCKGIDRLDLFGNNVLFRFLDSTGGEGKRFTDRASASGIVISARKADQNNPRWGQVLAVGPDSDVKVGEYIFIEGSAWSPEIEFAGEKFWKTDDYRIIMTTDDIDETL